MTNNWIELEGAHNVRDLGGLPTDRGITRPGVLLRSDALDSLSAADVEQLVATVGLTQVIDLRSASERADRGRGLLGDSGVRYSELDVISEADITRRRLSRTAQYGSGADPEVIMADGYVELLELGRPAFSVAIERLVAPGGTPALVHSAAGKDRTGVLVALLLDVAGVDRDVIVTDYAATHDRMAAIVARLGDGSAYQHLTNDAVPSFVFEAHPGTMARFLDRLDDRWGGAGGYFEEIGVGGAVLESWRDLFVVH